MNGLHGEIQNLVALLIWVYLFNFNSLTPTQNPNANFQRDRERLDSKWKRETEKYWISYDSFEEQI